MTWIYKEYLYIAPGVITRHEADKTTNNAVRQNFITGNCWLAAAIENLRQDNNSKAFEEVVQIKGNKLEFRWGVPILYTF